MRAISRRNLLGMGVGAAAALGVAGCSSGSGSGSGSGNGKNDVQAKAKPIGDGSTADAGPQPHQPDKPRRLEPGETPPQFVIFSWDGAGEVGNGLFPRFRKLAKDHNAAMTFFLSGLYCLPESKKHLYRPPNNKVGASDIGYLSDEHIKATLKNVREAWLEGHEIGTHFNGHFCGEARTSVEHWTPAQWQSEIDQAMASSRSGVRTPGFTDWSRCRSTTSKELVGGRTPCLARPAQPDSPPPRSWACATTPARRAAVQRWPKKKTGLWDFPLQQIPVPGHRFEVLSMDYNILANQSKNSTKGPPANYPGWRKEATGAYIKGFERAYKTNRAPLFVGNHFEQWNGGIYMDAVEEALKHRRREAQGRAAGLLPPVHRLAGRPGPQGRRQAPGPGRGPEAGRRLEDVPFGGLSRNGVRAVRGDSTHPYGPGWRAPARTSAAARTARPARYA
ncbi:Lipoprotein OS=Streptomyces rimosus subsp. rimosus (strain ATCC / DSM 40260 / JCM 4667 / NRRL 2234) OX=1265868 GN=SRIM_019200 PE=4 SV=1 [Streptomyces rimosus subsp. rimosus]